MKFLRQRSRTSSASSTPVTVRSGVFDWRGHRLAYELYGDAAGVPCVLIHGILMDSVLNRDLARRFVQEGFQVALLDLLGHGNSERSTRVCDHRVDLYAEQAIGLLDHLRWPQALVGGVSLGAITALQVVERAPKRVSALFLEMPVMEASTPSAAVLLVPPMLVARFGAPLWRVFAHVLRRVPRPRTDWLASLMNGFSAEPENVAAILHGVFVGPIVPSFTARREIRVPTLVIGHGGDRLHVLQDARRLAEEIPGAHLLQARSILELRTHPESLWPQVSSFLHTEVLRRTGVAAKPPRKRAAALLGSSTRSKSNRTSRP
ncbi:MAG: alpha/beta fold hydrolase [Nevskiaceae bacterium]|nr:MAG: alpha/beta fold hydrolase [Nevskiaceae bacterium]TBR74087.1 MAG: alpha/beta fold hydrolase [Nevskiaceae bacterium]